MSFAISWAGSMSEWITLPLAELMTFREGPGVLAKDFHAQGVPLIRLAGLKEGAGLLKGCNFLDPELVSTRWSQFRLALGEVLLSSSASLGEVATVDHAAVGAVPYTGIIGFRARDGRLCQRFIPFVLTAPTFKRQIQAMGVGSVMRHFGPSHLRQMNVSIPPINDQEGIADVLGALDDKVAANTKLVALLSENLEASFTSIVREPESFVAFSDLATVTKGVSYRSVDLVDSRTALVTLKSFDRTGGYSARGLKDYAGPYKPVQQIHPGEIVVAQTDLTQAAEVVGRAIRVPASRNHETLVASLDLAIVRPVTGVPVEFILGLMLQGRFRTHCKSRTSGTTVLHLASAAIPTFSAPRVSAVVQQHYASVALPMLEMSDSLTSESEALSATRDALFPALMSGKLRVRDAEKVLEGVL
ncbi:restriction endonuclease S subunit [Cryobacterium psychrophilum]|uniref:Type I restriction modification DNA specificity domain-containing protein n=2 Tax=Cryobacterium psychrophilum TaxID=41988 RepID=A0A4Y8KNH5_9MICO|nr:restriction endonuclease S subunit [Cryobacterium psychrophilum]TFD76886.1 hypothetical protein E3T53_12755 [Cryobacterium psychrophilum]